VVFIGRDMDRDAIGNAFDACCLSVVEQSLGDSAWRDDAHVLPLSVEEHESV
jgi:hypothetical protein